MEADVPETVPAVSMESLLASFQAQLSSLTAAVAALAPNANLASDVASLAATVATLKASAIAPSPVAPNPLTPSIVVTKPLKVDAPRKFSGTGKTDPKGFIFQVETYCRASGPRSDIEVLQFLPSLFEGPALTWWRNLPSGHNNMPFSTWAAFTTAFLAYFVPPNHALAARDRLSRLTQTDRLSDYVNTFMECALDVGSDLSEREKFVRFREGLKPYLQREVDMRNASTFESALDAVLKYDAHASASRRFTAPVPHSRNSSSMASRPVPRSHSTSTHHVPMELGNVSSKPAVPQHRSAPTSKANSATKQFTRLTPELRTQLMAEGKCLYCRAPGHDREHCPVRPNRPNAQGRR